MIIRTVLLYANVNFTSESLHYITAKFSRSAGCQGFGASATTLITIRNEEHEIFCWIASWSRPGYRRATKHHPVRADTVAREIHRGLIDSSSNESGRDSIYWERVLARRPQSEHCADWPQRADLLCRMAARFAICWRRPCGSQYEWQRSQ